MQEIFDINFMKILINALVYSKIYIFYLISFKYMITSFGYADKRKTNEDNSSYSE